MKSSRILLTLATACLLSYATDVVAQGRPGAPGAAPAAPAAATAAPTTATEGLRRALEPLHPVPNDGREHGQDPPGRLAALRTGGEEIHLGHRP